MPISNLFGAILSLMLSQTTFHTNHCQADWLDPKSFNTITAAELAESPSLPVPQSITVQISCTGNHATVVVSETASPQRRPTLRRHISLADTPDATRTRTLALAASDAVRDFAAGNAATSSRAAPTPQTDASNSAPPNSLHRFREARRISVTASGFTSFPHPHAAPLLAADLSPGRWRLGLVAAGTRFRTDTGKVYTGITALHLGYAIWGFTTRAQHIGEVALGAWTGVVHARGLALSPSTGEEHTQPMGALHATFTYNLRPFNRVSIGFQLSSGWILGMQLRVSGDIIGGFNGFFATAGLGVQFRKRH